VNRALHLAGAARQHACGLLEVTSCPECGVPAEITGIFFLRSTDGPVEHVVVQCVAGHHFRMLADWPMW
jgi:hypothetical protein